MATLIYQIAAVLVPIRSMSFVIWMQFPWRPMIWFCFPSTCGSRWAGDRCRISPWLAALLHASTMRTLSPVWYSYIRLRFREVVSVTFETRIIIDQSISLLCRIFWVFSVFCERWLLRLQINFTRITTPTIKHIIAKSRNYCVLFTKTKLSCCREFRI